MPTKIAAAFLGIFLIVSIGCRNESSDGGTTTYTNAQLQAKLKSITLTMGVSQLEAQIIAECYFDKNVGCGAFKEIRDDGNHWEVVALFSYSGERVKGFYIDKNPEKLYLQ